MRLNKPNLKRRERPERVSLRKRGATAASALARGFAKAIGELFALAREMILIPAQAFLALAGLVGGWVLALWRVIWPLLKAAVRAGRRALEVAEREVTPGRAAVAVAVAASAALAIAQFSDYRGISIDSSAYAGVQSVVPAPRVELASTGSAQAWLGLPLAIAAAAIAIAALRRRPHLGRLLIVIGVILIAVSLLVVLPQGVDEGSASVLYADAHAELLGGFWAQLAAAVALIVCGPLISRHLIAGKARPAREMTPIRFPRVRKPLQRIGALRRRRGGVQGAGT